MPRAGAQLVGRIAHSEATVAFLVFLIAMAAGWGYLAASDLTPGPRYNIWADMMLPPVLFATGHGLCTAASVPASVDAFLKHEAMSLDPRDVPAQMETQAIRDDKFFVDRLYLMYAMGIALRLFDLSWASLNLLAAFMFGTVAAAAYGLFRLGMGRIPSFAGTALYVAAPVVLMEMPALRDFCKAPFILATMLTAGHLLAKRVRPRALFLLAAGMGFLAGLGVGFRMDSVICLPPLLLSLACARGIEPLRWRVRCAATALAVACFLIPSWPIFHATQGKGGNNAFYLTQGFSQPSMHSAGLQPASYAALDSVMDQKVYAYVNGYDAAVSSTFRGGFRDIKTSLAVQAATAIPFDLVSACGHALLAATASDDLGIFSKKAEMVARRLVVELVTTFPADVIARWYSAALQVLRNLQRLQPFPDENPINASALHVQEPLMRFMAVGGPWCALAALAIFACMDLRLALGAWLILMYFSGYPSLEFEVRHAFHVNVIAYWFPCFLVAAACRALLRFAKAGRASIAPRRDLPFGVGARRLAIFALLVAGALAAALYPARWYQNSTVGALRERYAEAVLEPVSVEARPQPGGTILYVPAALPRFARDWFSAPVESEYLVAEFERAASPPSLAVDYEGESLDLNSRAAYPAADDPGPYTCRYFFPVYDYSEDYQAAQRPYGYGFSRFKGIVVPASTPLKGLYRVVNRRDFPMMMSVWLPSEEALFKRYYTIGWSQSP